MPRARNLLPTKHLTISATYEMVDYLGDLTRSGLYGKNEAEAAERCIAKQIERLIKYGSLRRRGREKSGRAGVAAPRRRPRQQLGRK